MTYQQLIVMIQNMCNRPDTYFETQIPNFIERGISRIYNEAKSIGFQQILTTSSFVTGDPLIQKPENWRETISLSYLIPGTSPYTVYLLPRSYEFCKTYAPNRNLLGQPLFYADYSLPAQATGLGQLYIAPTPNANYAYELLYLTTPLFSAIHSTNFVSDRYPILLLDACMIEAVAFLKDDERIPVFESSYNRALQAINKATQDRYTDRTSRRDKD